jgi:MoaA/NifB/PqqE/SkfB family radical SAM enzyme
MDVKRISVELTNRCGKACWFCYNASRPDGTTGWTFEDLFAFICDCASCGVRAVSFGGGEPLESPDLFALLRGLDGRLFRSVTTNGLPLLREPMLSALIDARPDKVHVSVHFPANEAEVSRVIGQVTALASRGIRSGINLLVSRSTVDAARNAAERIRGAGIGNNRIVYLPMRGTDTPSPGQVASVAGNAPFQSMTCLAACGRSERFCSIAWDRTVAWCSYTKARRPLREPTYAGLRDALDGLGVEFCGGLP